MIPLTDLNPRRTFPYVNILLILINVAVFLHQLSLGPRAEQHLLMTYGVVPATLAKFLAGQQVSAEAALFPYISSMFLHGGWLHIIGNMWFLWIFGDDVEDGFGHFRS